VRQFSGRAASPGCAFRKACCSDRLSGGNVGGTEMKRLRMLMIPALVGLSILAVSCLSYGYLQSDDYVQARIRVATNPRAVADMQYVDGWTRDYGDAYGAHDVGVMVAN